VHDWGEEVSSDARERYFAALRENRSRRRAAEEELSSAREELGRLLVTGARQGVAVPEMARAAGVGLETAYLLARNTWGAPAGGEQLHPAQVEPLRRPS